MPNSKEQIKIPTKVGLAEARQKLNEMRRKEPSPELIKIIEEVTEKQDKTDDRDIAARPHSPDIGV